MECPKCCNITDNSNNIECIDCFKTFHIECTRIKTLENLNKLIEKSKNDNWICDDCKPASSKEITKLFSDMEEIKESTKTIQNTIGCIINDISTIQKDIQICQSDNKDMIDKLTIMQEEILILKQDKKRLENKVSCLVNDINHLEHKTREENVEIIGVPLKENENCLEIVKKIALELGITTNDDTIQVCHRVKPMNRNRIPSIIVKLCNIREKLNWVKLGKEKKLTADQINDKFENTDIFISEHIGPNQKALFYEARQVQKDCDFKYVWQRNGKIFMKKLEDSKTLRITDMEQLEELRTKYPTINNKDDKQGESAPDKNKNKEKKNENKHKQGGGYKTRSTNKSV